MVYLIVRTSHQVIHVAEMVFVAVQKQNTIVPGLCFREFRSSLIDFTIYGDTVNTYQESVNLGFIITAEDSDDYLSNYTLRLIINGGPQNGGELIESGGFFDENVMSGSIAGAIEIPMGSTEGNWNIRIILEDEIGAITNLGPSDLGQQNFQNYIYVDNIFLSTNNKRLPTEYTLYQNYPNPFNPTTKIKYNLPNDGLVNIDIYDLKGIHIKSLVKENKSAGFQVALGWNKQSWTVGICWNVYLQYPLETLKVQKNVTTKVILNYINLG